MGANYQLSDCPVPTTTDSEFGQMTALQNVPNLTPGTSINMVCKHHAIMDDLMRYAKFLTMEKSLLAMVKNYKWILHLLRCLGLQDSNMLFTPSQTITFSGGLTLSAGDVVKHFGWTADSFKHKSVWYRWAAEVAVSQEWAGTPPSEL